MRPPFTLLCALLLGALLAGIVIAATSGAIQRATIAEHTVEHAGVAR